MCDLLAFLYSVFLCNRFVANTISFRCLTHYARIKRNVVIEICTVQSAMILIKNLNRYQRNIAHIDSSSRHVLLVMKNFDKEVQQLLKRTSL